MALASSLSGISPRSQFNSIQFESCSNCPCWQLITVTHATAHSAHMITYIHEHNMEKSFPAQHTLEYRLAQEDVSCSRWSITGYYSLSNTLPVLWSEELRQRQGPWEPWRLKLKERREQLLIFKRSKSPPPSSSGLAADHSRLQGLKGYSSALLFLF